MCSVYGVCFSVCMVYLCVCVSGVYVFVYVRVRCLCVCGVYDEFMYVSVCTCLQTLGSTACSVKKGCLGVCLFMAACCTVSIPGFNLRETQSV